MFQISAMINLKTKFEGSSNCPCAKRNEEQRGSGRVCESRAKKNDPCTAPSGVSITKSNTIIYILAMVLLSIFFLTP